RDIKIVAEVFTTAATTAAPSRTSTEDVPEDVPENILKTARKVEASEAGTGTALLKGSMSIPIIRGTFLWVTEHGIRFRQFFEFLLSCLIPGVTVRVVL